MEGDWQLAGTRSPARRVEPPPPGQAGLAARASSRSRSRSPRIVASRTLPQYADVVGLTGFEAQTSGRYMLSYRRDEPTAPSQASILYEREPPEAPAALVYGDGAWSLREALDSPFAFVRAESATGANPASLPLTAWEMSCPGKAPHPWLPAPSSFSITNHVEYGVDSGRDRYVSPTTNRSLDRLDEDEWLQEVAHRRHRRQNHSGRGSPMLVTTAGQRADGDQSRGRYRSHSRSPRRESALERDARMARRESHPDGGRSYSYVYRDDYPEQPHQAAAGPDSRWVNHS
jgi:hypothetical protein